MVLMVPPVVAVLGTPKARTLFALLQHGHTPEDILGATERVVRQLTYLTKRLDSHDSIRCHNTLTVKEVFCF